MIGTDSLLLNRNTVSSGCSKENLKIKALSGSTNLMAGSLTSIFFFSSHVYKSYFRIRHDVKRRLVVL